MAGRGEPDRAEFAPIALQNLECVEIRTCPTSTHMNAKFHSARARFLRFFLVVAAGGSLAGPVSFGLTFNFVPSAATPGVAIAGFQAAGDRWSALFTDNMV